MDPDNQPPRGLGACRRRFCLGPQRRLWKISTKPMVQDPVAGAFSQPPKTPFEIKKFSMAYLVLFGPEPIWTWAHGTRSPAGGRADGRPRSLWVSCPFGGIHFKECDLRFERNLNLSASVKPSYCVFPGEIKRTLSLCTGSHLHYWPSRILHVPFMDLHGLRLYNTSTK